MTIRRLARNLAVGLGALMLACIVAFVAWREIGQLRVAAARRIDTVTCHSFDADSVDNWQETDADQRNDLERRWQASFAGGPSLRHVQISKRINRTFHAREITARLASGRVILWDLDNGIDGVMRNDRRCVVACFPQ